MSAPRKYSVELQQRATRMAMDARKDPATSRGAIKRIADQLEHSCAYSEAYWQAVSEVARTLLKELCQQSAKHSFC